MRFSDTEKISVTIRDQRQVLTYSQLGLVDSRSGKPSKQWELLLKFAREHGMMTWLSPDACRKNRKQRELLNKSLQHFFDIEGEPIELTDDRKGGDAFSNCITRTGSTRSLQRISQIVYKTNGEVAAAPAAITKTKQPRVVL